MPSLTVTHAFNSSFHFSYIPVAVFVGGTGGIAASMAEALSRYTQGNLHVIIAGRNPTAGRKVLNSLTQPLSFTSNSNSNSSENDSERAETPGLLREFIFCDASSMQSAGEACKEITKVLSQKFNNPLPKINFLVFSAGYFNLCSSKDTPEGIDLCLAVRYYHRFKMTNELLPLLRNARDVGEDAKMYSILAAGISFPVYEDDLSMKNWKVFKGVAGTGGSAIYNDLMIESFANRERGISFTHAYPGSVRTGQLDFRFRSHWLFTPFRPIFDMLEKAVTVSSEECAEYMLYALFDAKATPTPTPGNSGKGSYYRRGKNGEDYGTVPDTQERKRLREKLYLHSLKETGSEEV